MFKSLLAALLVAGTSMAASAATITQAGFVPTQKTDFTASFGSFNAFDTGLGILTSVVATFSAMATDSGTLRNTSSTTQSFTFATSNMSFLTGSITPLQNAFGGGSAGALAFSSPTAFYTLASNQSAAFPTTGTNGFNPSTLTQTAIFTGSSELQAFENGAFSANLSTLTGQSLLGGGGNIDMALNTTESGLLTIAYNYAVPQFTLSQPVPEPASFALLGTGLAALGLRRRNPDQTRATDR